MVSKSGAKPVTPEQIDLSLLQAEVARQKMDNETLKSAAAPPKGTSFGA
jgi:hypothetical protein